MDAAKVSAVRSLYETYHLWLVDVVFKPCMAELQTDDVQQTTFVLLDVLVVLDPVLHRHLKTFLCVDVHHVKNTTRPCNHADGMDGSMDGWLDGVLYRVPTLLSTSRFQHVSELLFAK